MAEKVTVMVLKVDLQCPCCYKKVKKILCKFPQIRDQMYNEKANTVTITVVCCNPEKLRDKLCCKGAKVIKSIEILDPRKPPQLEKTKDPEELKEPEKTKVVVIEKTKEKPPGSPTRAKPDERSKEVPKLDPVPDPVTAFPVRTCCGSCYEGQGGGPCYQGHHGFGVPPPPQPSFDGYSGYGYGHGGYDRPCHVSRCDTYLSEENPQSCAIM